MEFIDLKKQYQFLKNEIDEGIAGVLNKNNYILGEEVGLLEEELASYVGAKYCVCCANGTDALTMTLKALNIGKGDVVFVPTFTFFASAEVVSQNGSICAFVDSDPDTFNMSAKSLEQTIQLVLKNGEYVPKAIMSVDLYGQCANYDEIRRIANAYGLFLIEDGAQGFGGRIRNQSACSFGDISTTSFFPAKPLGCYGDGGALFTDDEQHANLLKSLRFHGKGSDKYDNVRLGYNSRLDTIQAAVLRVKLKAFEQFELTKRNEIARIYDSELKNIVKTPFIPEGFLSSYAQYTLTLRTQKQRDDLHTKLLSKGIPSMIYYPRCMHQQTFYQDYNLNLEQLKVAESLTKTVLSIPMHPYLENDEIEKIVQAVKAGV